MTNFENKTGEPVFDGALKVALAQVSSPAALVFDEVDRGVGGAVADAVGERLQRLAETTQVLLVTHSPQVAARAEAHWRIAKAGEGTRLRTVVEDLSAADREEEIARMLAGAEITDAFILTKVKSKFVGEDVLKGSDINVDCDKHIVRLRGTVTTAAAKERAITIAKPTDGVDHVIDELTIGPKK